MRDRCDRSCLYLVDAGLCCSVFLPRDRASDKDLPEFYCRPGADQRFAEKDRPEDVPTDPPAPATGKQLCHRPSCHRLAK